MNSGLPQTQKRNTRIHFSYDDDIHLLREVLGQNPYENNFRWGIIQSNVLQITGKMLTIRAMKDRVKNLVNKFLTQEKIEQFKSGTEEEVTELNDLLKHIADLINEFKNAKVVKPNQESSYQKGFMQRENAVSKNQIIQPTIAVIEPTEIDINNYENEIEITSVEPSDNTSEIINGQDNKPENNTRTTPSTKLGDRKILTPTRKRSATSLKQTTLNYLLKKNERWDEHRKRELALQERKQLMDEKKFELDSWEKKKKIEMEEKKLDAELNILKNQQKLLEFALNNRCNCHIRD